jgi:hypothetical protein
MGLNGLLAPLLVYPALERTPELVGMDTTFHHVIIVRQHVCLGTCPGLYLG